MRHDGEAGMTLVELLVATMLMLVLAGATLVFLESSSRTVGFSGKETQALDEARTALATMAHEIRMATVMAAATASCPADTCLVITAPAPVGGYQDIRYRYDATQRTLYRTTGSALLGTWAPDAPQATDVVNSTTPVFCRATSACTKPNENSIQIVLDVNVTPTQPQHMIVLESYATPRNPS